MNSLQPHRAGSLERDRSADDLDGLLSRFFRAQMLEPWPALEPPAMPSVRTEGGAARRLSGFRSRFALAASLLILLLGQLFVSSQFSGLARLAPDNNRGRLEATNRIDSAPALAPKPASSLKKTDAHHPGERTPIPRR
ncbi:MAG TPA: hypothetical protein VKU02_33415 [Gemmataceae bacterium]|nr:hypothetical protein [Gemmataceae bacterium]